MKSINLVTRVAILLLIFRLSGYSQNIIEYQYDATNKITGVNYSNSGMKNIEYDAVNNRIAIVSNQVKSLTVKMYIEGLYNQSENKLNKAHNGSGYAFDGNIADNIKVELHQNSFPYSKVGNTFITTINTEGNIIISLSSSYAGNYYLVVKHRNSIETWSAIPISFNGLSISYDFTSSGSQAYGSNLKNIAGQYCIYGGDVNQDGVVDGSDMSLVENASNSILVGYYNEDSNGDGVVDGADMAMVDNNSTGIVHVQKP